MTNTQKLLKLCGQELRICGLFTAMLLCLSLSLGARAVDIQPRIIGGVSSAITEYPWQAALVSNNSDLFNNQTCGASIVHERWLITAAHCMDRPALEDVPKFVVIGLADLTDNSDPESQVIEIKEHYIHADFNPGTLDNDIALIELIDAIDLAACQAHNNCGLIDIIDGNAEGTVIPEGTAVWISGWGNTQRTGEAVYSQVLQSAQINTVDCLRGSYTSASITANMICAESSGKDTCAGDSGGPMVALNNLGTGHVLVGLTSWGPGVCATPNEPGVYTRLANYGEWIKATTLGVLNVPSCETCGNDSTNNDSGNNNANGGGAGSDSSGDSASGDFSGGGVSSDFSGGGTSSTSSSGSLSYLMLSLLLLVLIMSRLSVSIRRFSS